MAIIKDLKDTLSELQTIRKPYEEAWRECVRFAMPNASRAFEHLTMNAAISGLVMPTAEERGRDLYDTTFVTGLDRLTAGMVSLATPQGDKWHGVGIDDPFGADPDAEGEEWQDGLRDYLFRVRYDPRAGFSNVNERSVKHACGLGTGIYFVKEAFGKDGSGQSSLPFKYEFVPLIEAYIMVDGSGVPNGLYRLYTKTARNLAAEYPDKISDKVRDKALDPSKENESILCCHAVFQRGDLSRAKLGNKGARFASFLFEVDHEHLIGESGFYEFPYVVDYWSQEDNGAYGQSAIMAMIGEAKSLMLLNKQTLRASQQMTDPSIATTDDNLPRLNLNPRAVNPGYIDENGRLKAQPIVTATNLNFAEALIEMRRAGVRDGLHLNLWNLLASDRQKTAQEILAQQNEKAELVGPAGARIQAGRAQMVEREIAILERKGAFRPDSPLAAPKSMQGKSFGVKFTSPLDRLRRTSELMGVDNTLARAFQIAQYDDTVMDNIDGDETLQIVREIGGAPRKMLRKPEEVAERRQARAQQQQAMQAAAFAKEAGQAGDAIGKAAQNADAIRNMAGQMGLA